MVHTQNLNQFYKCQTLCPVLLLISHLIHNEEEEKLVNNLQKFLSFKFGDVQDLDNLKLLERATTLDFFFKV